MRKQVLIGAAVIAAALSITPLTSQAAINIDIGVAPPAPQVEVVPAPRPGFVWAPGYWAWDGGRHVWTQGHWIHERRGYAWVPEHWVQRGDHYRFVPGHWQR